YSGGVGVPVMLRLGKPSGSCIAGRACPFFPGRQIRALIPVLLSACALATATELTRAQSPAPSYNQKGRGILLASHGRASVQVLPPPQATLAPPQEQTISGVPPVLHMVPQKSPQSAAEVAAFVEGLSTNDATLEVLIGEGRLLTLKENIALPGRPRPI